MKFDQIAMMPFWSAYYNQFKEEKTLNTLKELLPQWESFVVKNCNGAEFLSGTSQPMGIDLYCQGMFNRLAMLETSVWNEGFERLEVKTICPNLLAYVGRVREHPFFKDSTAPETYFHAQIKL